MAGALPTKGYACSERRPDKGSTIGEMISQEGREEGSHLLVVRSERTFSSQEGTDLVDAGGEFGKKKWSPIKNDQKGN